MLYEGWQSDINTEYSFFAENRHTVMAPTFKGIELEDGNVAVTDVQVTRCRLTFRLKADHNVWFPNLYCN